MTSTDRKRFVSSLPELPSMVTTRDGVQFDPRSDTWIIAGLTRASTLKFHIFTCFDVSLLNRVKWGLLTLLQSKSFSHATNLYETFRFFYANVFADKYDCEIAEIDISHILNFKGCLTENTEWKLGSLRVFLSDMRFLGFDITSREAMEFLDASTIRGNIKGTSVRTRDPKDGGFTDIELLEIQSALNDAYSAGRLGLSAFALTWVFLAYGLRAIQIAALKEQDLIVSEGDEGKRYALRIPSAKGRGQGIRTQFNTRYCSKQVGELLENLIQMNIRRRLGLNIQGSDWPMFMGSDEGPLPELRYHQTSHKIGLAIKNTIKKLTGLKGNAKRFRNTLAQRAVDDGKDKYTVAELLDHSDTQNVGVYFEASPAMVLRLDRHLAMAMAPLAQAFAGVVIATESEARRGKDRSSRIYDRSLSDNVGKALGSCGQMSFCGLAAPFACYTCRHFQPWVDGPHEEFMAALIADRERMEADGYSAKIYTIRDRTILAAAEVIQLCSAEIEPRGEVLA